MDGTMWYMSFLLLWYIAFFCIFYFKSPMVGKVGLLMLLGFAFRSYWLKDTFAHCAWQFYTNAYAFPLGVCLGYAMDCFNRSRFAQKWKEFLCSIWWIGVFAASLVVFVLGVSQKVQVDYWKCGIAMFFVLYGLLSLIPIEVKVLKWRGANSFMLYLVEAKLIAIWGHYAVFKDNLVAYLISYAAVMVAIVYLYQFGSALLRRLRAFWEGASPEYHLGKN